MTSILYYAIFQYLINTFYIVSLQKPLYYNTKLFLIFVQNAW